MSRPIIHDDFLLANEPARALYHHDAKPQPIIDYHNHLSPQQIANNYQFADLTELWLSGERPDDLPFVGKMVEGICFANARDYFHFDLPADSSPRTVS